MTEIIMGRKERDALVQEYIETVDFIDENGDPKRPPVLPVEDDEDD